MYRRRLLGVLLAVLSVAAYLPLAAPPASAAAGFVSRQGTSFVLDGQPFRFGGTNNYYLHYKSNLMVDDALNDAQSMNLKVMRSWTFLECGGAKPNSTGGCSAGNDLWMQRWSAATNAVEYNEGAGGLQKLDYMVAQAAARGIKLIMVLTGNWKDFGGMDQYVTWYGLQNHDQFYTDARIKQDYKNWAAKLINRTNSITGVQYKNDPAIFSWELANEPRCINASLPTSGTCTTQTLVNWASEMSTYIKGQDPNHMVSVGDEGFLNWGRGNDWPYNATDGVDHEALTSLANIDFGTFHLYPDGWGRTVDWGTQWIADHVTTAVATHGKPTILEEFGSTNQATRDSVYQTWVNTVSSGGGDGWMFWILTGIQDDGTLYPDFDGFRIVVPSSTATMLSAAATAIGGGGPDTSPPLQPGTPAASTVTATGVTLTWGASGDNVGVTGYDVLSISGSTATTVASTTGTTVAVTGLTANTSYVFAVVAHDAAGNTSPRSGTVNVTTTGTGAGGTCQITYTTSDWSTGFTASVTVANTGTAAVNGWTLRFTFPGSQQVTSGWSATWTQSAANVTATSMSYNGALAPGASTSVGFNGSHNGTNPKPTSFTLNGNTCTTG